MMFAAHLRQGVREGRITCSVRIWQRPRVRSGGIYRMEEGHIVVESIRQIALEDVTGELARFVPDRWRDESRRPGAWLPFGAGPHACPGRNLGMAQLVHLAQWGTAHELRLSERVTIDQSRGIMPHPCRFSVAPRTAVLP